MSTYRQSLEQFIQAAVDTDPSLQIPEIISETMMVTAQIAMIHRLPDTSPEELIQTLSAGMEVCAQQTLHLLESFHKC